MALGSERMPQCAGKHLDTADIVRDGDFSPVKVPGVNGEVVAGRWPSVLHGIIPTCLVLYC
jgi:hypothetical protein